MPQSNSKPVKPVLPHPCSQEQHEAHINDLVGWYAAALRPATWEQAEVWMETLRSVYMDGWNAREFTF
jgi:hypothetical protein